MIIPTLLIAAAVAAPVDGAYSLRGEQVIRLKTTAEGVTATITPAGFNTRQAQSLPEEVVLLRANGDSLFASAPGVAELCTGIATSDRWRTIRWVTFVAPLTNPPSFILPNVLEPLTEQQAQDLERRLLSDQNDAVWIKGILSTNAQWSCTYLSNSRAPDTKPRCEKNGR
jgi:hypothetical protein